eukprot:COSAG03_NODE_32523_length_140_cov_39.573222_1_plen_25_part_10
MDTGRICFGHLRARRREEEEEEKKR